MQNEMIDIMLGKKLFLHSHVLLLQEKYLSVSVTRPCLIATLCLQNTPLAHRYCRYSHGKGLAGRAGDSFRV